MKPIETPAVRLTAESILRSFRTSRKQHLFITGLRGSGKSTLLRRLAGLLQQTEPAGIPFLTTTAVPGKHVILSEHTTGLSAVIGQYQADSCFPADAPSSNRMRPVLEGFLSLGIPALRRAAACEGSWVCVDELGYLESSCAPFLQSVEALLTQKQVLAVLRKQDTGFLNRLRAREDAFVLDLDAPLLSVGCVIMASGLSRRFGGNKLLADFHGAPLISQLLHTADASLFTHRVVVTRTAETAAFCQEHNIQVLLHSQPGRNDAVRLGLTALSASAPAPLDGCLFCAADQPLLHRKSLEALLLSFSQNPHRIYRLSYDDIPGNPVLFPAQLFPELLRLPEHKGGSFLAQKYPEQVCLIPARDTNELSDVDTCGDLSRLMQLPCPLYP